MSRSIDAAIRRISATSSRVRSFFVGPVAIERRRLQPRGRRRARRLLQQPQRDLAQHGQIGRAERQRLPTLPSASAAAARAPRGADAVSRVSTSATSLSVSRPNRSRMQRDRTVGSSTPGTAVVRMKSCRRRLLERFQQRVLRLRLERVGVANDHDAAAAFERPEAGARQHVADDVDLDRGAVVGLEREHVDVHAARDAIARPARAARIDRQPVDVADRAPDS